MGLSPCALAALQVFKVLMLNGSALFLSLLSIAGPCDAEHPLNALSCKGCNSWDEWPKRPYAQWIYLAGLKVIVQILLWQCALSSLSSGTKIQELCQAFSRRRESHTLAGKYWFKRSSANRLRLGCRSKIGKDLHYISDLQSGLSGLANVVLICTCIILQRLETRM